tara:strand:- start:830 stop:1687 length:858 start_codon:yes stop_codon:yes gene_type:complete
MSWAEVIKTNTIPWKLLLKMPIVPNTSPRVGFEMEYEPNAGWNGRLVITPDSPIFGEGPKWIEINWGLIEKETREQVDIALNEMINSFTTFEERQNWNKEQQYYTERYGDDLLHWPMFDGQTAFDKMLNEVTGYIEHESFHEAFRYSGMYDELHESAKTVQHHIIFRVLEEVYNFLVTGGFSWNQVRSDIVDSYTIGFFKQEEEKQNAKIPNYQQKMTLDIIRRMVDDLRMRSDKFDKQIMESKAKLAKDAKIALKRLAAKKSPRQHQSQRGKIRPKGPKPKKRK